MSRFNRRTVGPIVLVVVGALLAYLLVPRFGTRINIGYFLLQSVPLLLTAVGQTLVIITAGIDLSVGACVTLVGRDRLPADGSGQWRQCAIGACGVRWGRGGGRSRQRVAHRPL